MITITIKSCIFCPYLTSEVVDMGAYLFVNKKKCGKGDFFLSKTLYDIDINCPLKEA